MRADILPRAFMRVAVDQMRQLERVAERALGAGGIAQPRRVLHEQREQRDRVGAPPFARLPGLVPADRAIARQPDQRIPAAQLDLAFESRCMTAQSAAAAIGQDTVDGPRCQRCVDPSKDSLETRCHQPREPTGPARKAL